MEKLVWLAGKWRGKGTVLGKGVNYIEETTFNVVKTEPAILINAQQYTWKEDNNAPLHVENGFIKILPVAAEGSEEGKKVEASFSHPFSLNEFEYGVYSANKLDVQANKPEHFQRGMTAKGKQTTGFRREYWLNEKGNLCYRMHLAVDGGDMEPHLEACLEKQQ